MDLGLHHPYLAAQLFGGLHRFRDGETGYAARRFDTVFAQDFLALVFVDIHDCLSWFRRSATTPSIGKPVEAGLIHDAYSISRGWGMRNEPDQPSRVISDLRCLSCPTLRPVRDTTADRSVAPPVRPHRAHDSDRAGTAFCLGPARPAPPWSGMPSSQDCRSVPSC